MRRSLVPRLVGARVCGVTLARDDIVRSVNGVRSQHGRRGALLHGARIKAIERRGKQLAIVAEDGRTLCVHLGMSGQLRFLSRGERLAQENHVHCRWQIEHSPVQNTRTPSPSPRGRERGVLVFRDPRRFGGLWTLDSFDQLLAERWNALGPDALTIRTDVLHRRLGSTARAIKAALLDQHVLAGVGNIYADEALFRARLHPLLAGEQLTAAEAGQLAAAIRHVLRAAIDAGGTTLRDYADGYGEAGGYAARHAVYGRSGSPCRACAAALEKLVVAQRSTVFCRQCQPTGGDLGDKQLIHKR